MTSVSGGIVARATPYPVAPQLAYVRVACSWIFGIAALVIGINYMVPSLIPSFVSPLANNAPLLAVCAYFGMTAAKGMSASGAFEIVIDENGDRGGDVVFSKLGEKRMPEIPEVVRALAERSK